MHTGNATFQQVNIGCKICSRCQNLDLGIVSILVMMNTKWVKGDSGAMYSEKSRGLSDGPCGTPVPTADVLEENPRHRTNEDLECRYDLSQSSAQPVTPTVWCSQRD